MKNETNFHKDLPTLLQTFSNPGAEYRGKPFWSWNGELERDELLRQARIMKEMGLGGFFMHARAGLITEYLGREWFELTNAVADEAAKLGMEAWLYDEDRWPSGSAGGKVTIDPRYRMKSLVMFDMPARRFAWDEDVLCAFRAQCQGIDLAGYAPLKQGEPLPLEGRILKFAIVPDPCDSVYNGTTYIDTMSRAATDRFIELTHEAYREKCGDRLGAAISGIFTDEPHRGHGLDDYREEDGVFICSMAWTDDLFDEFRARYGYDVEPVLPEVFYRYRGEKVSRARIHYFDLANNLFLERFAMPIHDWCRDHNMRFTGHVLHEDALSNQSVAHGSLMRFYQHMDDPGVDVLSMGDKCYWIVKQLTSAARQLGKRWLLSELYGCTGWQMSFNDYKAVGDWQALFGINLRCPHLSWYTMEGESKRDYPASILHQSAWYKDFARLEDYFARFGVIISEGEPHCEVLVINPIESAWALAHAGWSKWLFATDPDVLALEEHYARLFHMLAGRQIDFDYGEEQMMAADWAVEASADGPYLRIGKARYRCAVVSGAVTLRPSTVEILRAFLEAGGRVIFAGDLPGYVDGLPSQAARELLAHPGARAVPFDEGALADAVTGVCPVPVAVTDASGAPQREIFCQVRRCADAGMDFAVLLNVNRGEGTEALVQLPAFAGKQAQLWDLMTGERQRLGVVNGPLKLTFEPGQERVLAFTGASEALPSPENPALGQGIALTGPVTYELDEPNVLVLDHAAWRWAGGDWQAPREVLKTDRAIRDSLGLEHRSGSMLQPWFAKLHDRKVYGRLELRYRFMVDALPDGDLFLVSERPENWTIILNGMPLAYDPADGFWVDIAFKRIRLPQGILRTGENEILLSGDFMRTTNVEALYLLGNFGVSVSGERAAVCPLPDVLTPAGNLAGQRLPFYGGRVTYRFLLPEGLEPGQRLRVALSGMKGSLALVQAADGSDRAIFTAPYAAEIPCPGDGLLTLTLVCTRRNTFGPLHQLPVYVSSYGPGNFTTEGDEWSDGYALADCRLGEVTVTPVAGA